MPRDYSAVIAAAGQATRYGGLGQLMDKVGGKSVLCHSIDRFDLDDDCQEIILTLSPAAREWVDGDPLTFASPKLKLVQGGDSRVESIAAGVRRATAAIIVLQDGNRPNFSQHLLQKVKSAVLPERGVAPGLPLSSGAAYVTAIGDEATGNGSAPAGDDFFSSSKSDHRVGHIMEHAGVGGLYSLQTPQAYYRESFLKALDSTGDEIADYADDSAVYLAGGYEVAVVAGHPGNISIITADELNLLLKLMGSGTRKRKDKYGGLGW